MSAREPAHGGDRALRLPLAAASPSERLPVALPGGFLPDLLFTEARATLTLRRKDGADEPPRLVEEAGCRVEGSSPAGRFFAVIDAPADSVLDRLAAMMGGHTAALAGSDPLLLAGRAAAWAAPIRARMQRQERAAPPPGFRIREVRWEARISLGAVRIARRESIPLPADPTSPLDPSAALARSHVEIRVAALLDREGRNVQGEAACWLPSPSDPDEPSLAPLEGLLEEALRRAADRAEAITLQAMEAPAVFSPSAAGILIHEICGHLLEGDLIAAGTSPFAGRIGERLATGSVIIFDDPLARDGRIQMSVDDEGEGTSLNVLFEEGRLAGYLTDRRTAALLGRLSTGNGRRESYRQGALPRMTNLVMAPGEMDPGNLPRGIQRGIFVERLGRGQVDPRLGRFRLEIESGRLIEGGRLTHAVAGGWLAGSCLELLAGIEGVGSDAEVDRGAGLCIKEDQIVPVGQIFPSLRVARLKIHPGAAP